MPLTYFGAYPWNRCSGPAAPGDARTEDGEQVDGCYQRRLTAVPLGAFWPHRAASKVKSELNLNPSGCVCWTPPAASQKSGTLDNAQKCLLR